jgi:hypothetical protein
VQSDDFPLIIGPFLIENEYVDREVFHLDGPTRLGPW